MGYITIYKITIYASPKRKVEIINQIAVAAGRPLSESAAYITFKHQIEHVEKNSNSKKVTVTFELKWWDPILDFRGSWYNRSRDVGKDGKVEPGIVLEKGEKLLFVVAGEDDTDRWKATVTHNGFCYKKADRVEYIIHSEQCPNNESDDEEEQKCSGCSGCAVVIPIYDNDE